MLKPQATMLGVSLPSETALLETLIVSSVRTALATQMPATNPAPPASPTPPTSTWEPTNMIAFRKSLSPVQVAQLRPIETVEEWDHAKDHEPRMIKIREGGTLTGRIVLYLSRAPLSAVGCRWRKQGPDPIALVQELRDAMVSWAQQGELRALLSQSELQVLIDAKAKLAENLACQVSLRQVFDAGLALFLECVRVMPGKPVLECGHKAIKEGIERLVAGEVTLVQVAQAYLDGLSVQRREPSRPKNTQRNVMQSLANQVLPHFGPDTKVVDLVRERDGVRAYFEGIDQKHPNSSYPANHRRFLAGCLSVARAEYGIHYRDDLIPPFLSRGASAVEAPKAAIIDRLLDLLQTEAPELYHIALVQAGCGLRPEESCALEGHEICEVDKLLKLPATKSKANNPKPREIHLRPWFLSRLHRAPLPKGPLVPMNKSGRRMSVQWVCKKINHYLRKAGWTGKIGKEPLRKSFCSACVRACPEFMDRILREVGHADPKTFYKHYDAGWTRADAIDYFLNFLEGFACPLRPDDPELWRPHF